MSGMSPKNAFGDGVGLAQEVGLKLAIFGVTPAMLGRIPRENKLAANLAAVLKGEVDIDISSVNSYADEEVSSDYTYPKGYRVKPIVEQTSILCDLFSGLGYADKQLSFSISKGSTPEGAEGWFAIPRWEKIAETYNEAVEKMFAMISSRRKFNSAPGRPVGLRQCERTKAMWKSLGDQQKDCDILVFPAQFGLRHRGRSVRRAREVFADNEFGLGVFAVGCMLLTHPEREVQWEQLHVDCAGDEFSNAPCFCFYDDKLTFYYEWINKSIDYFGAASAFLWE